MTSSCQSCSYHRRCVQEPWETKQSNDYCSFQDKWLKKKILSELSGAMLAARENLVLAIWITSYQERKCQEERKEPNQNYSKKQNKNMGHRPHLDHWLYSTGRWTISWIDLWTCSVAVWQKQHTKMFLFLLQFEHHSPGEEPQDGVRFYCSTNLSRNMGGFD